MTATAAAPTPTASARSTRCARSARCSATPTTRRSCSRSSRRCRAGRARACSTASAAPSRASACSPSGPNLLAQLTDRESLLALPAGHARAHLRRVHVARADQRRRPRRRERELAARRPARRPALVRGPPARHARPLARRDRLRPRPDRRGVAARVHLRADAQPRDRLHRRGRLPQGARRSIARRGACLREGYRRGRRAAWLPGVEWEALLEQPLARVREQLGVGAPPAYQQVRSEGAPALAA